jgi:hypothetical protein
MLGGLWRAWDEAEVKNEACCRTSCWIGALLVYTRAELAISAQRHNIGS